MKARLLSLLSRFRPPSSAAQRTGRRGERLAARALRRAGYRILARNVRTPRGEIDVVALEREVLVIAEVKSAVRPAGDPVPASRLRPSQCRRLRAAGAWLARHRGFEGRRVRHDLVNVVLGARRPVVTIHRGRF